MKRDESFVHVAVRRALKQRDWKLAAGQYPGGSDDECYALNVVDPSLACDNSPDPRRHSDNKLVPDLFALKTPLVLVTEMKPQYSAADESKLVSLLTDRREHLHAAMNKFGCERGVNEFCKPEELVLIPALGFLAGSSYPQRDDFVYFLVDSLNEVKIIVPEKYAKGF